MAGKLHEQFESSGRTVKIVLVTGYGPTTAPPEGEEDLVDGIIGKPLSFRQVTSTLEALKTEELVRVN